MPPTAVRSNPRLVTLGESLGLLTASEHGPLAHSPHLRMRVAGAEANVAIGVRRLGCHATWCGVVGEDPIGDLILRELRAEGVELHTRRDPAPTGLMIKEMRGGGRVHVHYWRTGSAGAQLAPEDVSTTAITETDVLHVTGITAALGTRPQAAIRTVIDLARDANATVSLDLNYRSQLWEADQAKPVLLDLVKRSDIVFASTDEAELLLGHTDPTKQAADLLKLGATDAVIKIGADGAIVANHDQALHESAHAVDVVDPVGAGDATAAGYLASWLSGADAGTRLRTAIKAAAFVVGTDGDWEGLPTRQDLARFVDRADPVSR